MNVSVIEQWIELLDSFQDAYLKFSVSLYLLQNHTNWGEGHLTSIKSQLVSNRNLCYSAIRNGLPGMMKIQNFETKYWQPPMLKVSDLVKVKFNLKLYFRLQLVTK